MLNVLRSIKTPQDVPQTLPSVDRQVQNNAGGYVFKITDFERFKRFLILGSESGTYYVNAKSLTKQNAECIEKLCEDGRSQDVIDEIVRVSTAALAPKQSPGIFALAVCIKHPKAPDTALKAVKQVCRTASTLFELLEYLKLLGGISWGRAMRKTIEAWYTDRTPVEAAYQITKYASRNGWTHRDVLRLAHPSPKEHPGFQPVFSYAVDSSLFAPGSDKNPVEEGHSPSECELYLKAVQSLKQTDDLDNAQALIKKFPGKLGWEHVGKTELLKSPKLWGSIIQSGLPMTAMVRNLVRFADNGVLDVKEYSKIMTERLTDMDALKKSRIHPVNILQAHRMLSKKFPNKYDRTMLKTLDTAFYAAFGNIVPSNKRFLIGLDVSGSMGWGAACGMDCLTPRDAAAAISLMLVKTEPVVQTMAFEKEFRPFNITKLDTLDSVSTKMSQMPFGGTDCALPITYALANKLDVDCFVILTDSETWAGPKHVTVALNEYRKKINPEAKVAVLAFASTGFTIADPEDKGMMDVAGFDASVPDLLRSFVLGF